MLPPQEEREILVASSKSLCEDVQLCQENPELPIIQSQRLEQRLQSKQESGAAIACVTFVCPPKIELQRDPLGSGNLVFIPDTDPSKRTVFEIKAKRFEQFSQKVQDSLPVDFENTLLLADAESIIVSTVLQIPIVRADGRIYSSDELDDLYNNYAQRFTRKVPQGQSLQRSTSLLPIEGYLQNPRWEEYREECRRRNLSEQYQPRLLSRMQMFTQLGMSEKEAYDISLLWLSVADAQYAIEGEFLATEKWIDAVIIIDGLPNFQAEKHAVGSKNDMSYICPVAKNEQG
jgi:hypothetical protein